MIRKSGWLVFLALVAFILLLVYAFAGTFIRWGMIYSLEKSLGAEVNIDDVSLGLFPLSIEIEGVQITDKSQPTHNLVQFQRAAGNLEVWPALLGYYVIDELAVTGLAMNQERDSEGEVFARWYENEDEEFDLESLLQVDLPSADDLIARANLQTEAKGEELKQLVSQQEQQLKEAIDSLPDRARLDEIQQKIETLVESDIENAADLALKAQQLKELKAELQSDRDNLRNIRDQIQTGRENLTASIAAVREASSSDWQTLQDLANISEGGLAPISQIILGDVWGERIGQIEDLYRLVGPYLPDDIKSVVFGETDGAEIEEEIDIPNRILPLPNQPYPDFWVKNASINWLIAGGEADLNVQNITSQHAIIGTATQFDLDVVNLPSLSSFNLDGDFSIFDDMITNMNWALDGFSLSDFDIGSGENAFEIASALLASSGSLNLINSEISQEADVLLQEAIFGESGNKVIEQLLELLNDQTEIPFSLAASGIISDPDISIRSKLDQIIGDALLSEAKDKIDALQTELRADVRAKLAEQIGEESQWLTLLDEQEGEALAIDERIQGLMEAELSSLKEEATDRLRDGILRAIGG